MAVGLCGTWPDTREAATQRPDSTSSAPARQPSGTVSVTRPRGPRAEGGALALKGFVRLGLDSLMQEQGRDRLGRTRIMPGRTSEALLTSQAYVCIAKSIGHRGQMRSQSTPTTTMWLPLLGAVALLPTLIARALPAQDTFRAQDFLNDGYRDIIAIDFAQLRQTGVWDEINIGATKLLLGVFEKSVGTSLENLERFRMVPCADLSAPTNKRVLGNLMITEGNAALRPLVGLNEKFWVREPLGEHELVYRKNMSYGSVSPFPNVRLTGPLAHLRAKLPHAKQPARTRPGLPCPDILSLMSARKDGLLAYAITDLHRSDRTDILAQFDDVSWPADDEPQFILVRILATGDVDDPHVAVEIVVRHTKAGAGIQVTDQAISKEFDTVIKTPRYRFFAKSLQARKQSVDGCDLSITVDLGRARHATGNIEMLVSPWLGRAAANGELRHEPKRK